MSRRLATRFATQTLCSSRSAPLATSTFRRIRWLSQSNAQQDDAKPEKLKRVQTKPKSETLLENIYGTSQVSSHQSTQSNAMANLSQSMVFQALNRSSIDTSVLSSKTQEPAQRKEDELEPYHFHIYAHKHNTHVTCTKPNREPIISLSCGNIGFKKSRRGTFDAAYSLTKYVLERLTHTGWPMKIQRLELVLRGFGQGREAAVKVLMNPEGKILRDKIVRVADSTRIKFAGTRSEKPRRL